MTPETPASSWTRVRAIYEELCDLPSAQRERALASACGGDAQLRAAVERLLAHDSGEGDSFLGEPVARLANLAPESCFELAEGTAIGGFRILRRIGQGGMGAVYEAAQQLPQRRVALKVLRPELATQEALRRFDIEVESLARMQHPDIARVHDAGIHAVTAQGLHLRLPWYAMELIVGARDLVTHARECGLDRNARLALLARVAEAVHHAHLRGIVHRDLKPANVLVDETGAPKIIDFGIARAIDASAGPETTRTGALLGTPRYMAPEQKVGGGDIDARCDVWALGRMLRELLELPLAEATQPVQQHARALPRELGWILDRACANEPAERYGSALALAEDLRRFLRGDAVLAAPPSFVYEWAKMLKRHRATFAAAAAVLLSLGAGLLVALDALEREQGTSAELQRARGESESRRVAAERASENAQSELRLRTAMLDLVRRTVGTARTRFGAELTVAQLVEQLARELELERRTEPRARGAGWNYLADIALANGDLGEAERMMDAALASLDGVELDQDGLGDRVLALCGLADIHRQRGALDRCESAIEEARSLVEEHGLKDGFRSSILRREVLLALQRRQPAEALRLAEENLALRRRIFGERAEETAEAALDRGTAANQADSSPSALAQLREACELADQVLGPLDPSTLAGKNNLAVSTARQGDWASAAELLEEIAAAYVELNGAGHPTAITLRSNLATAWTRLERWDEAAALLEELIESASSPASGGRVSEHEQLEMRRLASISRRESGDLARAFEVVQPVLAFTGSEDERIFSKRAACRIEGARALARRGETTAARELLTETREALAARVGEEHALYVAAARELAALDEKR